LSRHADACAQNVYAIDLSKNGEVRSVLATVPEEHGSQDPQRGLWRFNDSRAAPGGQIIAGRYSSVGGVTLRRHHVRMHYHHKEVIFHASLALCIPEVSTFLLYLGRMSQNGWQDGVAGWVYKLQQAEGAAKAELSVLFEQGRMGLPNGMCWNMVCHMCDGDAEQVEYKLQVLAGVFRPTQYINVCSGVSAGEAGNVLQRYIRRQSVCHTLWR
jgi:hypothetical protein